MFHFSFYQIFHVHDDDIRMKNFRHNVRQSKIGQRK